MVKISVPLQRYWLRRQFLAVRRVFAPADTRMLFARWHTVKIPKKGTPRVEIEVFNSRDKAILKDSAKDIDTKKSTLANKRSEGMKFKLPTWPVALNALHLPVRPQLPAFPQSRLQVGVFLAFTIISVAVVAMLFAPYVYYRFAAVDPVPIKAEEEGSSLGGAYQEGTKSPGRQVATPAYDETLPEGTWLIIPSIGINAKVSDSQNSTEALSQGVWRVPEYGTPGDLTQPVIMAAHRYGYQWWWKSDYWKLNSFYELPQLKPGDIVEVIYGKRKYTYEVYAGEEGKEISDYDADIILYTCKFLNSPVRHFRYARQVDPLQH